LFAANEALERGGVMALAATVNARSTINSGIGKMTARNEIGRGIRRPGARRKREVKRQPTCWPRSRRSCSSIPHAVIGIAGTTASREEAILWRPERQAASYLAGAHQHLALGF
jgi:hypothetical protein